MDPRVRADQALARARARGAFVVTPDNAISPMDAASTVRIPRNLVTGPGQGDPESTMAFPNPVQEQQPYQAPAGHQPPPPPAWPQNESWPQNEYGQPPHHHAPEQVHHPQQNPNGWAQLGGAPFPPRRHTSG